MKSGFKAAGLAAAMLIATAGAASAQTYTFNTTGSMADNGTYGNSLTFSTTTTSSLQMKVTGWQSNQSTNAITSAYVGAYSPGLGVTGIGDSNGTSNYHQIDNAGGYTDFILLQFNAPVALSGMALNSFALGSATTIDNDLAYYATTYAASSWNSPINLTSSTTTPASWTTLAGAGANGSVSTGTSVKSAQWLIGAAFNSGNNDGFKIASIFVTVAPSSVPEPATWAMMIAGFGMVGVAMRRGEGVVAAMAAA